MRRAALAALGAGLAAAQEAPDNPEAAMNARCADVLAAITPAVQAACCADAGACAAGVPAGCGAGCAAAWTPFALKCSRFLDGEFPQFAAFTEQCEAATFPAGDGRCDEGYWAEAMQAVAADCCGDSGELCGEESHGVPEACAKGCQATFERFYARCHPAFGERAPAQATRFLQFLTACQEADDEPPAGGEPGGEPQQPLASGPSGCAPAPAALLQRPC